MSEIETPIMEEDPQPVYRWLDDAHTEIVISFQDGSSLHIPVDPENVNYQALMQAGVVPAPPLSRTNGGH